MGLLGPNRNKYTVDDMKENLDNGEMGEKEAAIYGVTLAQEAYRNGELSRDQFHDYIDQAEKVALTEDGDVTVPEVDASIERLDDGHFNGYDEAREAVANEESLQNVDLVAVPGPQNLGVGVNMADELGVDYTLMVAEDEDKGTLGYNADGESVRTINYGPSDHDIELHGEDLEGSVTAVGGHSWGRGMHEADPFYDGPDRLSDKAFRAVMEDGSVGDEIGEEGNLIEFVREKIGF
jgi:hypothetical protein